MYKLYAIFTMSLLITAPFVIISSIEGDEVEGWIPTRYFEDWTMDMDISDASNASFFGEAINDQSGCGVSGAGDVNGDGYNDILIGAFYNDEGGNDAGQTYLILGKPSGWPMDTNLSHADASFIGEASGDQSGYAISSAGDVNGDGYDDILIGALGNNEGGNNAGQTYLILGKAAGWAMDTDLSNADASFIGEASGDYSGRSISGAGDVNGDGYDDILISAYMNREGGGYAGQSYLVLGRSTNWSTDMDLSSANASFIGEAIDDYSGFSVSGVGDVNGDGYDDILIGAYANNEGGETAGQTYLILGKTSGWGMDTDLSIADASYIGEGSGDNSGWYVSGAGDVNGDGYDDILIGAHGNDEGDNNAGQTYLIFGKPSGWGMDNSLSNADASFIGEAPGDYSGTSISGARDINGDGYDDILIGADENDEGGDTAGQTYLILGKTSGWTMDKDLSNADASFLGEASGDNSAFTISGAGDVNGDGGNDILIGAWGNSEGGDMAGQSYLILGQGGAEPEEVYTFESFRNPYSDPARVFDMGDTVYFELTGKDGDGTHQDYARINITFENIPHLELSVPLLETDKNSGIYQGLFVIPTSVGYFDYSNFEPRADPTFAIDILVDYPYRPTSVSQVSIFSDQACTKPASNIDLEEEAFIKVYGMDANIIKQDKAFVNLSSDKNGSFKQMIILGETGVNTGEYVGSFLVQPWMEYFENITVTSVRNPSRSTKFMVHTPVQIRPLLDVLTAVEDEEYRVQYWNFGYETATWSYDFNVSWLNWDEETNELYGTPMNNHVGSWDVFIEITDGKGHMDSNEFQIVVSNAPPNITTENVMFATEGIKYYVDYNCSDDGQGDMKWATYGAPWLSIDQKTGELSGTPVDEDCGVWNVSISVEDGHLGIDSAEFHLEVLGVNKPPSITIADIMTCKQGEKYYRDYEVYDSDIGDTHHWELTTNASFLTIDEEEGILEGTPGPNDVGVWSVNVTVIDSGELMDSHIFDLTVENINDMPYWIDTSNDITLTHSEVFYFDFNAEDPDIGDVIVYSVRTEPQSDMYIDPDTGEIDWIASVKWFEDEPFRIEVTIEVTDGEMTNIHIFFITIIPTQSPTARLTGPESGTRTPSTNTVLEWEGSDPEDEPITYDIYIHENQAYVEGMREEALHMEQYVGESYIVSGVDLGRTYYWMVVPHDGCSYGDCTSGSRSFTLNNPPTINDLPDQEISAGSEFRFRVSTTDDDDIDKGNLIHTLIDPPEGMTISEDTGTIKWKPNNDQAGWYTITVDVYDGVEKTTTDFNIEVIASEENEFPIMIIAIIGGIIALVMIALLVFLVIRKREPEEEKEPIEKSIDEEEEEIIREMEEHQKELEWEHDHYKDTEESNVVTDVPLSAAEAHAHDKDKHKKRSYEDLYGQPAPEIVDEDVTTEDLKETLKETVEKLEQMEPPEEEDFLDDLISHAHKESEDIVDRGQESDEDQGNIE